MYKGQQQKILYRGECKPCEKIKKASYPPSKAAPNLYGDEIECIKCHKVKLKEEFYWNTTSGYINKKCKPCFDENNKLKERYAVKRFNVLKAYGHKCNCCGEEHEKFLTFDHKNNDGAKHRENIRAGWSFYKWLEENEFPNTIQILCWNCNWAKSHGGCPHQKVKI